MRERSASSPLLRATIRNSVFSGLGAVLAAVIAFGFAGLKIRYLGEARAGYLLAVQAVFALCALVGVSGLRPPGVRRVAALHGKGESTETLQVVGSLTTISLATGLFWMLLIIAVFPKILAWSQLDPAFSQDAFWATVFLAGTFLIGQLAMPLRIVYEALQRFDLITGLTSLFGILTGVFGILLLMVCPSMTAISLVTFGVGLVWLACDALLVRRLLGRLPMPTWSWSTVGPMFGLGKWAYLMGLGSALFTNLDRVILTSLLGTAALPYYSLPQSMYSHVHTALGSQYRFLLPMFSSLGDAADAEIRKTEDRLRWFISLTSGAAYAGVAIVGPSLLSKLVNPEFARMATIPLMLACVQGFLHAQSIVPHYVSWAIGEGSPNAVPQIINGVLVSATSILLIPSLGYVGASVAQLWIGATVAWQTLWVRRLLDSGTRFRVWLRPYLSPALMIITWIGLAAVGLLFVQSGSVGFYTLVFWAGVVALGVVWIVEQKVFPRDHRWDTLSRALTVFRTRVQSVLLRSGA